MTDIKTKLSTAMWRDLKTDDERATWLLLGRGFETGVVCKSIQNELAMAYSRLIELRQALAELPNFATDVAKPQNTQAQELFGKTEQLEAEIKRLQELADYRLKLLTKMPSEWVGLTDEDMEGMFLNAEGIRIARYIETRLKDKNNA